MKAIMKRIIIVFAVVVVSAFLLVLLADWCYKAVYKSGFNKSLTVEEKELAKSSVSEICARLNQLHPEGEKYNPATWKSTENIYGEIIGFVRGPEGHSAAISVWRNNGALVLYEPSNKTLIISDPMEFMETFFKTVRPLSPGQHEMIAKKKHETIEYTWKRYNENGIKYWWGEDTVFRFGKSGEFIFYRAGPGYPPCNDQPVLSPDDAFMRASYEIMRYMGDEPRSGHMKPIDVELVIHDPISLYRILNRSVIGHRSDEFGKPRLVYDVSINYSLLVPSVYVKGGPNDILIDAITGEVVFNPISWFARNFFIVW